MSKKLNAEALESELSGSAFFNSPSPLEPENEVAIQIPAKKPRHQASPPSAEVATSPEASTPRHHGVTTPRTDSEEEQLIEKIRRAVRPPGKEDATYRFSAEEKKGLADIVYTYSSAGIKTSQNEIARIAINNLLDDYDRNGAGSLLARVLERLNQ